MEIGSQRELEAAVRLQSLAKHTKLRARVKRARLFGRIPIPAALPLVLAWVAAGPLMRSTPSVPGGIVVLALLFLISASVLLVNDRVDALLELLESSGIIGPDLPAYSAGVDPGPKP